MRWASAAGKGGGGAVERDVSKPHRVEKQEPRADLAEDLAPHLGFELGGNHGAEEFGDVGNRHSREFMDPFATELDRAADHAQARAVAAGAFRDTLVPVQERDVPGVPQFLKHVDRGTHALGRQPFPQEGAPPRRGDVLPCRVFVESERLSQKPYLARPPVGEHERALVGDGPEGALGERQAPIRNHEILVEAAEASQPLAIRAGSERMVEGEAPRLQFGEFDMPVGAGAQGRIRPLLSFAVECVPAP